MTDEAAPKKPPIPDAKPAAPPVVAAPKGPQPEDLAKGRIKDLDTEIARLKVVNAIARGRMTNRNPDLLKRLKKENEALSRRYVKLQKALYLLLMDTFAPRQADDMKTKYEVLKTSTIDYCKKTKIDQQLWKNLES